MWRAINNRPYGRFQGQPAYWSGNQKTPIGPAVVDQGPCFAHHSCSWFTCSPVKSCRLSKGKYTQRLPTPTLAAWVPAFRKECHCYKLDREREPSFLWLAFFVVFFSPSSRVLFFPSYGFFPFIICSDCYYSIWGLSYVIGFAFVEWGNFPAPIC